VPCHLILSGQRNPIFITAQLTSLNKLITMFVSLVVAPVGPDSGENPDGTVDPNSAPTLDANGMEIPVTGPHADPTPEKSWVERLISEDMRTYYTTGAPIPAVSTSSTCRTDPIYSHLIFISFAFLEICLCYSRFDYFK
jgi:hypothetical protein